MTRHYIVRRLPTPYELHKAQERAETRRTVRDGVIAAVLLMVTLAAILAAGPMPARGESQTIHPSKTSAGTDDAVAWGLSSATLFVRHPVCVLPGHNRALCGRIVPHV